MASLRARVGFLGAGLAATSIGTAAREIESLGFAELWLPEDYFESSGVAAAAIALASTEQIPVGIGVISVLTRHPSLSAMEVGTLARAFPGRVRAGFGLGLAQSIDSLGLMPRSPLGAVRDTVGAIRTLLAGEATSGTFMGVPFDGVSLAEAPAERPTLLVGGLGPKMMQLAGEIADDVILSSLSSPAYVRWAREHIETGAERAGRTQPPGIVDFAWCSIDDDAALARSRIRPAVAGALAFVGPGPLTEPDGLNPELARLIEEGGTEEVTAEMPDAWIDELVIAGDAIKCRAAVAARLDAGADRVVLCPTPADRFFETATAFASALESDR